jgi:hypothetical protein
MRTSELDMLFPGVSQPQGRVSLQHSLHPARQRQARLFPPACEIAYCQRQPTCRDKLHARLCSFLLLPGGVWLARLLGSSCLAASEILHGDLVSKQLGPKGATLVAKPQKRLQTYTYRWVIGWGESLSRATSSEACMLPRAEG